jgi:hypothetical protein
VSTRFTIASLGHHDLPAEVCEADDPDVEEALVRAAAHLGYAAAEVSVERVASVLPGSCIACTEVIASVGGTRMLIATPSLY